jgi:hypothetical protein
MLLLLYRGACKAPGGDNGDTAQASGDMLQALSATDAAMHCAAEHVNAIFVFTKPLPACCMRGACRPLPCTAGTAWGERNAHARGAQARAQRAAQAEYTCAMHSPN